MGTSRRRTPAGARLNYGAQRRPDRTGCGDQKNCQPGKKFKEVLKDFFAAGRDRLTAHFEATKLLTDF
jgi:hypothetical protein